MINSKSGGDLLLNVLNDQLMIFIKDKIIFRMKIDKFTDTEKSAVDD